MFIEWFYKCDYLEFGNKLIQEAKKMIKEVNGDIIYRPSSIINGDITNVHDMMVAVEKASKSFKMMMEIRNNIIEAYREVMGARI